MLRQIGDALLVFRPIGNILVGREPATILHHVARNRDHPPVRKLPGLAELLDVLMEIDVRRDVDEMRALLATIVENLRQRGSGLYPIAVNMVDFAIARVRHHDPLVRIEHAKPLGHVVEGGVEAHVDRLKLRGLLGQHLLLGLAIQR